MISFEQWKIAGLSKDYLGPVRVDCGWQFVLPNRKWAVGFFHDNGGWFLLEKHLSDNS